MAAGAVQATEAPNTEDAEASGAEQQERGQQQQQVGAWAAEEQERQAWTSVGTPPGGWGAWVAAARWRYVAAGMGMGAGCGGSAWRPELTAVQSRGAMV